MRKFSILLGFTGLVLACRAQAGQTNKAGASYPTVVPPISDKQDWYARARTTADDRKKARAVILDGRFATEGRVIIHIAQAFEAAYKQKRTPQRLAFFAYAAENALAYAHYDGKETIPIEQRAMEALLQFPTGAEKGQDLQYFDVGPHFFLTSDNKIPEAWMAYGMYFTEHLDRKRAAEAYRQAIKLDPHFGEAWFALADLEFEPYHGPIPTARIPIVMKQLDRAEKEEPRIHLFVIGWRSRIAADTGDYDTEMRLLREAVSITPFSYNAKAQRKILAELEKQHPGH